MAEDDRISESEFNRRIIELDSILDSPQVRTSKVWNQLDKKNITNWDMVCFCLSFLKSVVPIYPWLRLPVLHCGSLVLNAHYFATDAIVDVKINEDIKL